MARQTPAFLAAAAACFALGLLSGAYLRHAQPPSMTTDAALSPPLVSNPLPHPSIAIDRRRDRVSPQLPTAPPSLHLRKHRSPDCGSTCCLPTSYQLESAAAAAHAVRLSTAPPRERIAYIKTHKTASSTVGSIMFRYAARHNLTMYKSPTHGLRVHFKNNATLPADLVLQHWAGLLGQVQSYQQWVDFYRWYTEVVLNPDFVTILREPLSHYVSYYYFYDEPRGGRRNSLATFAKLQRNKNILARDFGIFTPEDAEHFMQHYMPRFRSVLLSDRITESLIAMAAELGWTLWDLTSVKLLDSHSEAGSRRWDGKPLKPTPRISSLPQEVVDDIQKVTKLDFVLYNYAEQRLNDTLAALGPAVVAEAAGRFEAADRLLAQFCACGDLGRLENAFCKWYALDDMQYEGRIGHHGKASSLDLAFLPRVQ